MPPLNTLTRAYFHLYKPGSLPSITKDLGKSTSQPRSPYIKQIRIKYTELQEK
jgi:hypothetical protein